MSRGNRNRRYSTGRGMIPADLAALLIEKAMSPGGQAMFAGANRGTTPRGVSMVDAVRALTGQSPTEAGTFGMVPMPRNPLDSVPFGPLHPLVPDPFDPARRDTGRPEPRVSDYPVAWNIPGAGEKLIPWRILREAADGVDIMRRCIEIRKRHIRGLDSAWAISEKAIQEAYLSDSALGREDAESKLREQFLPEIKRMEEFWAHPWKSNGWSFGQWLNGVIEDHLVLDGVAIYPRSTYGGDVLDLEVVDATTIKPLLDYRGVRPSPPFPAFQQNLQGFPRGEFHATVNGTDAEGNTMMEGGYLSDQLFYGVENVRSFTPYGYSAVEQALISAKLYLARQGWMIAEYDDGVGPVLWLVPQGKGQGYGAQNNAIDGMNPRQRQEWEDSLNDLLRGNTKRRNRAKMAPPGMEPKAMPTVPEQYKSEYDLHLIKLLSGHFGVTMTELGFTESKGLGNSGVHEGQADVEQRVGQRPDERMIAEMINELSHDFLRCPPEICFKFTSLESEDTTEQDAVNKSRRERATITLNDERREIGKPPLTIPEADMPMILNGGAWVPLEGLAQAAQAKVEAEQALVDDQLANSEQQREVTEQTAAAEAEELSGQDAEKALELAAYTRWRRKDRSRGRMFMCKSLEPGDWPGEQAPDDVDFEAWAWVAEEDIEKAAGGHDGWRRQSRDSKGRWVKLGHMRADSLGPDRPGKQVLDGLARDAASRRGSSDRAGRVDNASTTLDPMTTPKTPPPVPSREERVAALNAGMAAAMTGTAAPTSMGERIKARQEKDVTEAIGELADQPGGWVSMTDLRKKLQQRGLDRGQQDAVIKRMALRFDGVNLVPEDNQKTLSDADHAAAIDLGAGPQHLIQIEPKRTTPAGPRAFTADELRTGREWREQGAGVSAQPYVTAEGEIQAAPDRAAAIALLGGIDRAQLAEMSDALGRGRITPDMTDEQARENMAIAIRGGAPRRAAAPVKLSRAATARLADMVQAQGNAANMATGVRRPDVEELESAGYAVRDGNWSVLTDAGRAAAPEIPRGDGPDFTMTRREESALARKAGFRDAVRQGRAANAARDAAAAGDEGPRDKAERLAREREAADPLGEAARLDAVAERWEGALRASGDGTRDAMARNNAEHARREAARIRAAHAAVATPPGETPAPDKTPVPAAETGRADAPMSAAEKRELSARLRQLDRDVAAREAAANVRSARGMTNIDSAPAERQAALRETARKLDEQHAAFFPANRAELERDIASERAYLARTDLDDAERKVHETMLAGLEQLERTPRGDAAVQATKAARELIELADAQGMIVMVSHSSSSGAGGGSPYFNVQAISPDMKTGFKATFHTFKGKNGGYGRMSSEVIKDGRAKDASLTAIREHVTNANKPAPTVETVAPRNADPSTRVPTAEVQEGDWRWHPSEGWQKIGMIEPARPYAQRVIWGEDRDTKLGTLSHGSEHIIARQAERPTLPPRSEGLKGLQRKPGEPAKRGDVFVIERKDDTYYGGTGAASGVRNPRMSYETYEVTGVTREGKVAKVRRMSDGPDGTERKADHAFNHRLGYGKASLIPGDKIDKEGLTADLRAHTYNNSTTPKHHDDLRQLGDVLYGRMKADDPAVAPKDAAARFDKLAGEHASDPDVAIWRERAIELAGQAESINRGDEDAPNAWVVDGQMKQVQHAFTHAMAGARAAAVVRSEGGDDRAQRIARRRAELDSRARKVTDEINRLEADIKAMAKPRGALSDPHEVARKRARAQLKTSQAERQRYLDRAERVERDIDTKLIYDADGKLVGISYEPPTAPAAAPSVSDMMAANMAASVASPSTFGAHGKVTASATDSGVRKGQRLQHSGTAWEVLESPRRARPDAQGRTGWLFRVRREDQGIESTMRLNDGASAALAAPR